MKSKKPAGFGRRPMVFEDLKVFSCLKSDDFQPSPASGHTTLSILLLQVEELRSSSVSGLKILNILMTCRTGQMHRPEIMTGMSLYTRLSYFGICLRSSVKEITAINTSILLVGLLHSVSWYSENYPGLVLVLSAMTRLWRRRSRKKEPLLIARSKASQRERKDLPSDQNDLKSWTAEKIADESFRISSIRSARLGKGREFELWILIRA